VHSLYYKKTWIRSSTREVRPPFNLWNWALPTCMRFVHMPELHAHGPTTRKGERESSWEELDPCTERKRIGEWELSWRELDSRMERRWTMQQELTCEELDLCTKRRQRGERMLSQGNPTCIERRSIGS
jgi:hypothetical protein